MTKEDQPIQKDAAEEADPSTAPKRKADVEELEVDLEAPEPPSKRARRALKKGKALPEKPKSDDEGEDGSKKKKDDKAARSEHGVWIGNLPFTVTGAELRKWLIDNSGGVITEEAITRVKIPTTKNASREPRGEPRGENQKPENKGFAYVDFADIGGKVAAIAMTEATLGNRKLLIKDAKSFEGRPNKEPEPVDADGEKTDGQRNGNKPDVIANRKVFVGNMGFKTSEEDVRRNFEKCGEIEWVKIAQFEDTGKCKGYGWVMFKEPEGAAWAAKGFVKIKEKIETEDDFKDDDDDDAEEEKKPKQQEKQFKTRKWWVNRMHGRELKLELAEDDASRYKKRFGKDAPNKEQREPRNPNGRERRDRRDNGNGMKTTQDIAVARLTGGMVEHTGSKVTFD